MEWYYIGPGSERLAFDEGEAGELVAGGLLSGETMVWREGMDDWVSASEVRPEWFRGRASGAVAAAAVRDETVVREVGRALASQWGWWVVLGVVAVLVSLAAAGWLVRAAIGRSLLDVAVALVLFPQVVFGTWGAVLLMRGMLGVARAAELGQRSRLVEEVGRVASGGQRLALGVLLTLVFGLVAFGLGAVFYWDALAAALGWESGGGSGL